MKGVPWRFLIETGAKSREKTERQLENIGKGLGVLVHLDNMDFELERELRRWKRKQLLASLRGDDPSSVEPPATLRSALAKSFIDSERKLVLALEEFEIVDDEEGEES